MRKIETRVKEIADYIIETNSTIREAAKVFRISKSTVHKDLSERLIKIDKEKYKKIEEIFAYHLSIRHLNGGESTKRKYAKM